MQNTQSPEETVQTRKPDVALWLTLAVSAGLLGVAALARTDDTPLCDTATALITGGVLLLTATGALALRRGGHARPGQRLCCLLFGCAGAYAALGLLTFGRFTLLSEVSPCLQLMGFVCTLALYLVLYACIGHVRPVLIAAGSLLAFFGVLDNTMLRFRERMVLVSDILSLRTAVNVAGSYWPKITVGFVLGAALAPAVIVAGCRLAGPSCVQKGRRHPVAARLSCVLAAVAWMTCFYALDLPGRAGLDITWNENNYSESPVLYLAHSVRQVSVNRPSHYSTAGIKARAAAVVSARDTDDTTGTVSQTLTLADGEQPDILVIMSESFSDLGVLGNFETNVDYMPFFDSIKKETIHGYMASSVFGGGTANSEYELLTGNTMAFIPEEAIPYQMYISYPKNTLVSTLAEQGYTTMATHPYLASGYNRPGVYANFGFDEIHFLDDFTNYTTVRGLVSDSSDYKNLIRWYEGNDSGKPMFLFNITMQNHSTYDNEDFPADVSITGHEGEFPEAEQYLSLIRRTDTATEELIDYFREQEKPIVILFFGDHQPSLETEFYETVMGKTEDDLNFVERQKKQLTPFYIWSNCGFTEEDVGAVSANYLSGMLLDAAGLEKTNFQYFLGELQEKYPVINAHACRTADGQYLPLDDEILTADRDLVNYQMFQYNFLFDNDAYLKKFFGGVA